MTDRRMAPSDAVWLYSEHAGNHQVVSALIWTDRRIDPVEFKELVEQRLVDKYPTFSQKMRPSRNPLLMPHWVDDPDFDIDNHIRVVDLPAPGDKQALEDLVSAQRSARLPRDKPLWEMFVIQGYNGDTTAVHARIQHAIADGWALVRLVLSLADEDSPSERPATVDKPPRRKRDLAGKALQPALDAADTVGDAVTRTAGAVQDAASKAVGMVTGSDRSLGAHLASGADALQETLSLDIDPKRLLEYSAEAPRDLRSRVRKAKGATRSVGEGAKDAVDFLMPPRPGDTILHGAAGPHKKVVWIDPIPLQDVKDIGRTLHATVNDVLLGALTSALRNYLLEHDALTVEELLTAVPISLRKPDAPLPRKLGNRFGLIPVLLPVGIEDPVEQIRAIKLQVDKLKVSKTPIISFGVTSASAILTPDLAKFSHKMNQASSVGITTNVPGPRNELHLAGAKVLGMWGLGGNSGDANLVLGIFSLNGELNFAVHSDAGITPDPERILVHFTQAVDELRGRTSAL
jgi:hypothetical protein